LILRAPVSCLPVTALRSIVHLDADAFFASVEQAADARLRGKPVAVGGLKRGIIASASYEARKFGIYTPMPTVLARRLCPRLILLPGDFAKYELFSRLMFSYAYDFTPEVEIGSIDEGYFDLTGSRQPPLSIAQTIRQAIRQALKLSVSEGLASNKLVSQIASKLKKPSAFQFVPQGHEAEFLSPLANGWLPGIGPKMAGQLNAAGLARIGQIARTPADLLGLLVGSLARQLRAFAQGLDNRPVVPARAPAQSYSEQETFAADTTDEEFLAATLRRMADRLMAKVRADTKSIRTLTVKIRYNDMDEEQAGVSLEEPTDLETEIYSQVSSLLRKAWKRRVSLRLVSLKLSNLYEGRFRSLLPLDAPASQYQARQRLADAADELRQKYGRGALLRGHDFILPASPAPGPQGNGATRTSSPPQYVFSGAPAAVRGGDVSSPESAADSPARVKGSGLWIQRQGVASAVFDKPRRFTGGAGACGDEASPPLCSRLNRPRYVPLNVHSYYSFLDSTLSIHAIVELACRYELPAIALTDKNNLHGAVEFAEVAAAAGIKAIIGAELECNGHRLCLYVENQTGYHNLCRILSAIGQTSGGDDGFDSRAECGARLSEPPIGVRTSRQRRNPSEVPFGEGQNGGGRSAGDFTGVAAMLSEGTDGLLAVSPASTLARWFPGRFYLEANPTGAGQNDSPALPCVAAFPLRYEKPADRWKYDVVQSIRTLTLLRQAHPAKCLDGEFHFETPAQMQQRFSAHPEWLEHGLELAARCSFEFSLGRPQFPAYAPPDGSPPAVFLRRLVMEGLERRYPKNHACLKPQLEEELAIITEVGYEEYFLVVWDILQECRRRGIEWITRGSAADSLACYCLGISGVCPIRFDLYFRRFLNKDRMALNKLPDIDVDFPHDRKDDVVDLVFEKYGRARTAMVGGFSTFQSRSAFAEVAKVLGVSEFQVRRITERLPHYTAAGQLANAIAESAECRDLPLLEEPYRTALELGQFLDGFPRYPKMHPCGLVISRQPINELVPCFVSAKGYPTTHFDMDSVEAVGLIKMDLLAQGGLAVMRDVKGMLEVPSPAAPAAPCRLTSPPINLEALEPWTEPRVWEMIAGGNARAVHHIESPAMISLCKMCNARDIDTLIAIVSVIRPGAANESKKMEFARRYQGLSPVHYPHPSLEACLRSTYGLVVYEEHILQICEAFAGLPPGRADILRRALAKDKPAVVAQIQSEFAACARRKGRTETQIAQVWELVAGFQGYAFCKAHSTAYGVEAYQSAWLKLFYPTHFMAAVLTNGKGFYNPLVYVLECHRLGIPLLAPSINQPGPSFTVVTQSAPEPRSNPAAALPPTSPAPTQRIRVPVRQIKGLTERTKEMILRERECGAFASLTDFFLRVRPLDQEMEALIRAGAFDEFGRSRTTQFWEFKARSAAVSPRQLWLLPPGNLERLPSVPLAEPTRLQRLQWEEELLGYPASGHPLELFPDIAWETYCPLNRLGGHLGQQVVTCGLVIEQRLFHQTTGEPMKFITIADRTGMVETELFARTYKSYGLNTVRYRVLEVTATVEPFENGRGYTLRVLRADKPRNRVAADVSRR